ncbi:hypothetical protein CFP66_28540 [Pseudonocardia sp. MH-G8]|nr:hypothetical protein CFP66_28540 [Pseudonocardia sp. MH-G8]
MAIARRDTATQLDDGADPGRQGVRDGGDRWFQTDMSEVLDLVRTSGVVNAAEEAVGSLE